MQVRPPMARLVIFALIINSKMEREDFRKELLSRIFSVDESKFDQLALDVFRYQVKYNDVYNRFLSYLKVNSEKVDNVSQIPFLPIEVFKHQRVASFSTPEQKVFYSSGTTSENRSAHFIYDLEIYNRCLIECFKLFYGSPQNYIIAGLLPSYLQQGNSSLVYMVKKLMEYSGQDKELFFLNNFSELHKYLVKRNNEKKILLIGVSYALLDFGRQFPGDYKNLIIMETGGMKGRREEITRADLHFQLKKFFNVETIHSEYGMTELLSQAYSKSSGKYFCPPWMKLKIKDPNDPLAEAKDSGVIHITDLANIDSCSFIATKDLGKINYDNSFEILGRIDNSDLRGCNLLIN